MTSSYYIGLMSGTSADGIDAALVNINANRTDCLATLTVPFESSLRKRILAACARKPSCVREVAELDLQLSQCYASAVNQLLTKSNIGKADIAAIGNHGQTVNHAPDAAPPFSLQIGNAQRLADLTGIAVVSDFRSADIRAGGQGAPLAPAFHNHIFRCENESRVVANLGGIANISLLPKNADADVIGFDTGPANCLMDFWASTHLNKYYDKDGNWAAGGKVNQALLDEMMADAYFRLAPPKSTGRELFNAQWLMQKLAGLDGLDAQDIQTTLCELSAITIANAIKHYAKHGKRIILCGGGAHNKQLVRRLQQQLPDASIVSSAHYGIDPDFVEAIAFAWLAYRHIHGLSGNLPSVTGAATEAVLGCLSKPATEISGDNALTGTI